ncbi:MAG: hypothetical protein U0232_32855 [Thermomicrobiales bacterium]
MAMQAPCAMYCSVEVGGVAQQRDRAVGPVQDQVAITLAPASVLAVLVIFHARAGDVLEAA